MLPKSERLKERHCFTIAFKKKQRIGSKLLTLYYLYKRNNINALPKIAFVVGVSISKKANKRNLIKRRMRAAYQLIKKKFINSKNSRSNAIFGLIWVANPSIMDATFEQIKIAEEELLTRLIK